MNKLCSDNIFNILSFLDYNNKNYIVNKEFNKANDYLKELWNNKFIIFKNLRDEWIKRNPYNKTVKLYQLRIECETLRKKLLIFLLDKELGKDLTMFNVWVNMYNDSVKRYNKLKNQKNNNLIQYNTRYLSPVIDNTTSNFRDSFNGWGDNYDYEL